MFYEHFFLNFSVGGNIQKIKNCKKNETFEEKRTQTKRAGCEKTRLFIRFPASRIDLQERIFYYIRSCRPQWISPWKLCWDPYQKWKPQSKYFFAQFTNGLAASTVKQRLISLFYDIYVDYARVKDDYVNKENGVPQPGNF